MFPNQTALWVKKHEHVHINIQRHCAQKKPHLARALTWLNILNCATTSPNNKSPRAPLKVANRKIPTASDMLWYQSMADLDSWNSAALTWGTDGLIGLETALRHLNEQEQGVIRLFQSGHMHARNCVMPSSLCLMDWSSTLTRWLPLPATIRVSKGSQY